MGPYFLQLLIAVDQLFNALFAGWADETLSSRAYRAYRDKKPMGFMRHVINCLFFWQTNHCYQAYLSEKEDRHLPPELRGE